MNYINLLHDNNKQSLFSRPTANPAGSSSAAMHAVRKMTGTAERQERDTPAKARRELPAKPPPFFYVLKYTIKANPSPNGNEFAFNLFGDPTGTRTRVTAVKGRCLRPLDHGAMCTEQQISLPAVRACRRVVSLQYKKPHFAGIFALVAAVGFEPTTYRV